MTHIILWLWDGWRPVYGPEHVNAMVRMLQAYLPSHVRIICVTDMPSGIRECETYPLWPDPEFKKYGEWNCYRRLRLFDPATQALLSISPGDWVISVDLDTVIMGDITEFITRRPTADFIAAAGAFSKYNGSLWRFTAGTHADVWHDFDYQTSPALLRKRRITHKGGLGSDQAWMSYKIENAPTWDTTHGLWSYARHCKHVERSKGLIWNFAGQTKPWDDRCKLVAPFLYQQYQRFL